MKALPSPSSLPTIDVQPEDESTPGLAHDTTRIGRLGLIAIALGFGGFLVWAALAPLDEGVPASGTVSVDTKRKAVQHLQGGIVQQVLVREGQEVEANQVLIRLDDAVARANFESSRQRYFGLRAMESRLLAEQTGLASIKFHPDLIAAAEEDPMIRQHIVSQTQVLQSRRASLAASIGAIDESIQGQQALIEGYRKAIATRNAQAASLEREAAGVRNLVTEGYLPWNKQTELERSLGDISATTTDLQAKIAAAQSAILELRQRAEGARSDYRKDVDSQLSDVRREVQTESEKFKAVSEDLARTEIRAPVSGQVVGLAVQTVGGVVSPGQKLMDIVPKNEALMLEAKIAPHLIDRLRVGERVDVRFAAFAHSPQLVVDGIVQSLSSDILVDPGSTVSYYLARVAITAEGMKKLGSRQLQPGMPVDVVVKTGERSMLTYLLHPLIRRLAASMKEE